MELLSNTAVRTSEEIKENIQLMQTLLKEAEYKLLNAQNNNDKATMRLLFFDYSIMKARIRLLKWTIGESEFPL